MHRSCPEVSNLTLLRLIDMMERVSLETSETDRKWLLEALWELEKEALDTGVDAGTLSAIRTGQRITQRTAGIPDADRARPH